MNLDFVKIATFAPEVKVCDVDFNLESVKNGIDLAINNGAHLLVLPEMCLTGVTVGDLIYSDVLLDGARNALTRVCEYTLDKNLLVFLGLPFKKDGVVYSVCACLSNGKILGLVPKNYYNEVSFVNIDKETSVPFGSNIIFSDTENSSFKIAVDFNQDLMTTVNHTANGARIIINANSQPEFSGVYEDKKLSIKTLSYNCACSTVFSNAGYGESTTDTVYSGCAIICENGKVLAETKPFESKLSVAEVDLGYLDFERSKRFVENLNDYYQVDFFVDISNHKTQRVYDKTPFIKNGEEDYILRIQAEGLKKRILHTHADKLVVGLSGGLDSTLALIVAVNAMKLAGKTAKDVLAITMPCFGTSSRTFENSIKLAKAFGVPIKKVDITKSVKRHLKDLNHPENLHDAAYENAQARERTQVLMDTANMVNGLVVGTGDLSELALGWATYNGDHMSMYAVNGSIPKTLVRHLVNHVAENGKGKMKAVLLDVIDTPVSPELLPPADDKIKQVTEDIVGPYILHDFFLYNMIKNGFTPKKIYYSAVNTFKGEFDEQTILKWLKTFVRRFFTQQFKRSCLPDGIKATEISLSPRGEWNMPSDAVSKLWLDQLNNI